MDTTYLDFISKGALIAQHTERCSQACGLLAMLFLIDWVQAEHLQHAAQQILFSTAVHAALQPVAEAPAALAEHVALPAASPFAAADLSAVYVGTAAAAAGALAHFAFDRGALDQAVAASIASSAASLAGEAAVQTSLAVEAYHHVIAQVAA